jgi:hypothetical protein
VRGFVDTEAAECYTGRSKWVLYRWKREGRVATRKEGGKVLWNVFELPPKNADGTLPPWPSKKS